MIYTIKYLDEETGVYMTDDIQQYEADSELDALRQFAQVRKDDLLIEDLKIVSEDPFILWVKGWTETPDHSKIFVMEGEYEYIAEETI